MNGNRLKLLAITQIVLGIALFIPPTYFFVGVGPQMDVVTKTLEEEGASVSKSFNKIAETLGWTGGFLTKTAGHSRSIANLLDYIPGMGAVAKSVKELSDFIDSGGQSLTGYAATIRGGGEIIRGLPAAMKSMRDTVTIMCSIGMIAAVVVVLNGVVLLLVFSSCGANAGARLPKVSA